MQISGQYTEEDYLEFQRLSLSQSKIVDRFIAIIFSVVIIGTIIIIVFLTKEIKELISYLPTLLLIILVPFYYYIYIPRKRKQVFSQDKQIKLPFTMEFTTEGINFTNSISMAKYPWNTFNKWKENGKILILYTSDVQAIFLPKRLINSDLRSFIASKLQELNTPHANNKGMIFRIGIALVLIIIMTISIYWNYYRN
jgi:hypothetical protein